MNCTTHWYVRAGESSCCVDVHPRNTWTRKNVLRTTVELKPHSLQQNRRTTEGVR